MAIKIVVDSASDIDQAEADKMGVYMIPMEVSFGEEQFLDGVNLSHKEFFEKLEKANEIPKTSQINEYRFDEVFKKLTDEGYEVIYIALSSGLSGTYNNAESASKKYDGKVRVIDSLTDCIGERILAEYALRLIEKSLSLDEIAEKLNKKKRNIKLIALLNTLKYLQKGGRISAIKAFVGEILNIKPLISIEGGVHFLGQAIGTKKGSLAVDKFISSWGEIDFDMPVASAYSGFDENVSKNYLKSSPHFKDKADEIQSYMIGSTIGTHIGPKSFAVAYFVKD